MFFELEGSDHLATFQCAITRCRSAWLRANRSSISAFSIPVTHHELSDAPWDGYWSQIFFLSTFMMSFRYLIIPSLKFIIQFHSGPKSKWFFAFFGFIFQLNLDRHKKEAFFVLRSRNIRCDSASPVVLIWAVEIVGQQSKFRLALRRHFLFANMKKSGAERCEIASNSVELGAQNEPNFFPRRTAQVKATTPEVRNVNDRPRELTKTRLTCSNAEQ